MLLVNMSCTYGQLHCFRCSTTSQLFTGCSRPYKCLTINVRTQYLNSARHNHETPFVRPQHLECLSYRYSRSYPATNTTCSQLPGSVSFSDVGLPDPFQFLAGSRVQTQEDWRCRREEISQLLQRFELGEMPPDPPFLNASFTARQLSINVTDNAKSISFTVSATLPTSAGRPVPAIISYGGASIPIPSNVAVLTFDNDDIALENDSSSRGIGKFYTLYGADHSAGALMAWAWAVRRILDALELTSAEHSIDLTRVGVTGCSRNGKGALVAGAFDERIALTIVQESGSGGAACWRLSDAQFASGQVVQTAMEIVQENVWFSTEFDPFVTGTARLPFDHHALAGMVAPRGLYLTDNLDFEWLGSLSCFGCQFATRLVYEALGAKTNIGFSQVGNHPHCLFPATQNAELSVFFNRFLLGSAGDADVFRSDGNFSFNETEWISWSIPTLQ
ncbi:hypothetical protein HGRIS_011213 [Hohenbuehelia grisea]|uniref:(4-O-methyl)-D-glucuronate--lignin esterase n=1 Tax=Hohenbuehelia grisea TaxID=104357 RepID=A0ABR3JWK6_9AGAR